MYGEWLREQFDKGAIPEPTYDPDLAILLSQLRENSINLFGPEATEVIEPVPMTDIRRAIKESLPGLIASIEGDERNVILTLARMWLTSSSGRICSKDQAAEWAIPKLAKEHATLLEKAKKAYLEDYVVISLIFLQYIHFIPIFMTTLTMSLKESNHLIQLRKRLSRN